MIDFAVFGAGQEGRGLLLSHAVALEHDAVGVVHDPVENGVGDGGVCDQVMPSGHRDLGGDQGGFAALAFLDDFEQMEALLVGEAVSSEVIEDEQLRAGEFVDEAWEAAIETSER